MDTLIDNLPIVNTVDNQTETNFEKAQTFAEIEKELFGDDPTIFDPKKPVEELPATPATAENLLKVLTDALSSKDKEAAKKLRDIERKKKKEEREFQRKAQIALIEGVAKLTSEDMIKQRDNKESLAPIYAKALSENNNISVSLKGENLSLYEWTGSTWKAKADKEGVSLAYEWCKKHFPKEATSTVANLCHTSALLELMAEKQLPPKPETIIIPFKDRWLEIDNAGTIKNISPNKNFGITHLINAEVGNKEEIFIPEELDDKCLFYKFLNDCLPDKEEQAVLQEYVGYTFLPDTRYQKAMVFEGNGGNGKGSMTKIISALHENVASIRLDNIGSFGLAQLPNSSLVVVNEVPKKGIDEEMFKQLISGDSVVIEAKQKDQFTYRPFAKWLISCNAFPKISDESKGVWRRVMLIKFLNNFEENKNIDVNIDNKIIANEMFNVVQWALIGLQRLLARGENGGFVIPKSMKNNIIEEQNNSNNVNQFIDDSYLTISTTGTTKKDEIYFQYNTFCEDNGIKPFGSGQFWKRMTARFPQLTETQKREGNERKRYVNLTIEANSESNLTACNTNINASEIPF